MGLDKIMSDIIILQFNVNKMTSTKKQYPALVNTIKLI